MPAIRDALRIRPCDVAPDIAGTLLERRLRPSVFLVSAGFASLTGRSKAPADYPPSLAGALVFGCGASGEPSARARCRIQSRYRTSGVTPVRPPQPADSFGPVDQLTTPTIARYPSMSRNAGAPESPAQAPSPAVSPLVCG